MYDSKKQLQASWFIKGKKNKEKGAKGTQPASENGLKSHLSQVELDQSVNNFMAL